MPQSINQSPDISQLRIDRKSTSEQFLRPTHVTTIIILLLIGFSIFHLTTLIFSPANEAISNEAQLISSSQNKAKPLVSSAINKVKSKVKNEASTSTETSKIKNTILNASGHSVARRIATVSSQITGKLKQLN